MQEKNYIMRIKPKPSVGLILTRSILFSLPLLFFLATAIGIPTIIISTLSETRNSIFLTIAKIAAVAYVSITIIIMLLIRKSFLRTEYKIFENRIEFSEQFLRRNKKTIMFKNVSNIGETSGIIQQWFGVSTIFIDTAGHSMHGHELWIHDIENSEKIYKLLNERINRENS